MAFVAVLCDERRARAIVCCVNTTKGGRMETKELFGHEWRVEMIMKHQCDARKRARSMRSQNQLELRAAVVRGGASPIWV